VIYFNWEKDITFDITKFVEFNCESKEKNRMAIQNLKACPRCNGRLLIKRDANGWYEECTKCGEKIDISELVTTNTVGQIKISNRIEIETNPVFDDKFAQGD